MEYEPQAGIRGGQRVSLVLNTENMRLRFWFLLAVVLSMELGESWIRSSSLPSLLSTVHQAWATADSLRYPFPFSSPHP